MNIGTELGGIEKSLIDFLEFLSQQSYEIDLALWKKRGPLFSSIPANVNIIENIGVGSLSDIRKQKWNKKIISYARYFLFKLARIFGNEYKVVPKIKKEYDIAISFCQNGYSPYYVIDKVKADKKYLWYHHGAYEKTGKEKRRDKSYYPKYDKVFAVSNHIKDMLVSELGDSGNFDVCPNFINVERIKQQGAEQCSPMDDYDGLKILSVGRLSIEKNPLIIPEIASELLSRGLDFKWFIVGAGYLFEQLQNQVIEKGLEDRIILCGGQLNPYKYMSRCDIYAQFSKYEADPITVKEVSVFNKKMVLSDIPAFRCLQKQLKNIAISSSDAREVAKDIISIQEITINGNNNLDFLNELHNKKTNEILSI